MYLEGKIQEIRYVAVNYCVRGLKSFCCLCFKSSKKNKKVRLMYFKFKGKRYLVNKPRRDLKAGTKGNVRQKYLGDSKQQKFFGCFI